MTKSGTSSRIEFLRDTRGMSTIEYVIILVLIAAAAVGTWSLLGQTVRGKLKGSMGELRQLSLFEVPPRKVIGHLGGSAPEALWRACG